MTRRAHGDLALEIPNEWEDKSVTAFALAEPGKRAPPSILVTKDRLLPGYTLQTCAAKVLADFGRSLQGFALIDSEETTLGGYPAFACRFASDGANGPLVQRQVLIGVEDSVYTITMSVHRAEATRIMPTFDRVLASIDVRGGTASKVSGPRLRG